jgi:hypothetical protein
LNIGMPRVDVVAVTRFGSSLPLDSSLNKDVLIRRVLMLEEEVKKHAEALTNGNENQERAVTAVVAGER